MGSFLGVQKVAARRLGMSFEDYQSKIGAGLKHCYTCGEWKPLSAYDVDRSRGNGRAAACIDCRRKRDKKVKILSAPSKQILARSSTVLHGAIRRGEMVKASELKCVDCGKPAIHYHHHLGYEPEHWLDVIPVCRGCHRRRHFIEQAS